MFVQGKKVIIFFISIVLISCGGLYYWYHNIHQSNIINPISHTHYNTTTNIIPWDTLVKMNCIPGDNKRTIKEYGKPKNDSLLVLELRKALTKNGFNGVLEKVDIAFWVKVDTTGLITVHSELFTFYPAIDSITENKISNTIVPVLKKSEPWIAPIDFNNKKVKGTGFF